MATRWRFAAYLKSLPPVSNKVQGPFGPDETPTVLVMSLQPGEAYAVAREAAK